MDEGSAVAVVDEGNRFVRWTDRQEVHRGRWPHRSVHVLLYTPDGRWVVQRRHPGKLTWPGHFDVAAAGHVERSDYLGGPDERLDEVYARVAARELAEELGVVTPLTCLGAFAPEPGVHYEHLRLYRGVSAGPFTLQREEVAEVRVVSAGDLAGLSPVTSALAHWLRVWAGRASVPGA